MLPAEHKHSADSIEVAYSPRWTRRSSILRPSETQKLNYAVATPMPMLTQVFDAGIFASGDATRSAEPGSNGEPLQLRRTGRVARPAIEFKSLGFDEGFEISSNWFNAPAPVAQRREAILHQ